MVALLPVSLWPLTQTGLSQPISMAYLGLASLLGAWQLLIAIRFLASRNDRMRRRLLLRFANLPSLDAVDLYLPTALVRTIRMSDHDTHGHDSQGHDEHHGHAQLQYQPALPLPNGKVCVWLFLSTEIMFFAGLIGTYIVLRFGAVTWPEPHDVHISEPIGAFNTFVLICSSVSIVLCLEAARASKTGQAKFYMLVTLALGSLFLGVKAYEYKSKFAHGIFPQKPRSLINEKPNLYYVSELKTKLMAKRRRSCGRAQRTGGAARRRWQPQRGCRGAAGNRYRTDG